METLFLSVLKMSLTASYVIAVVMLARLLLKKAPKIISYALWSVVAFRLLCPFSFESLISLLPSRAAEIPQSVSFRQTVSLPPAGNGTAVASPQTPLPSSSVSPFAAAPASAGPAPSPVQIGTCVWLLGIAAMLIYGIVSAAVLQKRLKGARNTEKNIYAADNLKTPFVLGIFRPRIYLPAGLTEDEKGYIVRHEQTHIRRFDHVVKPFAFLVLSIHWFNPLVWAAFLLMSTDMELSCDERVIRETGCDIRKAYSSSLLSLAAGKHILNGGPLAFGEGNIRSRIKNVLNYRKPAFWVVTVAVAAAVCVAVGLAANPKRAAGGAKSSESQSQSQSAAGNKRQSSSKDRKQPAALKNFVIADNGTALSDGRKVTVRLVMTDGKYYDQSQVPYGGGTYDQNYRGSYEIRVFDAAGKLLSKTALDNTQGGSADDINFPGKFNLLFDDYNRDGNPDFTIGQWGVNGMDDYQIFTVMPNGSVKNLTSHVDIFNNSQEPSVRFEKDEKSGFYATVYNMELRKNEKVPYIWNKSKNSFQALSSGSGMMEANPVLSFSSRETDLIRLGKIAFDTVMAPQKSAKESAAYRIASYRLDNISLLAGDIREFCVSVSYSITTDSESYADPTTGAEGKGTWSGIYCEIRVRRTGGNTYQIVGVGTGGGGQGLSRRLYVMSSDGGVPVGCEYGETDKTDGVDVSNILSDLDKMSGFVFREADASRQTVRLQFLDEKPRQVGLRCISGGGTPAEYPINGANYEIGVPGRAGVYNFFADLTWDSQDAETVYFRITVTEENKTAEQITAPVTIGYPWVALLSENSVNLSLQMFNSGISYGVASVKNGFLFTDTATELKSVRIPLYSTLTSFQYAFTDGKSAVKTDDKITIDFYTDDSKKLYSCEIDVIKSKNDPDVYTLSAAPSWKEYF